MRITRWKSLGLTLGLITVAMMTGLASSWVTAQPLVQLGPRPYYLVNNMTDSDLKTALQACSNNPPKTSLFSRQ